MAELVLLDPTAGLLHRGQAELDDVERVQDGGGVVELVADRVAVAAERVERGGADAAGERRPAGLEPVGVDLPGPARGEIEQPGPGLPVAPGQVHDAGHLLGRLPGRGRWCQICSSTPTVSIPASRSGSSTSSARAAA